MTYELPQRDSPAIVITCEHGGNHIPMTYRALFEARRELLDSHRGYDAGALCMARALAAALAAPLLATTTSRLLADLNRSATHPSVHAAFVRELPRAQRLRIVDRHHRPYRERAERMMREAIARAGRVIHIACHRKRRLQQRRPICACAATIRIWAAMTDSPHGCAPVLAPTPMSASNSS